MVHHVYLGLKHSDYVEGKQFRDVQIKGLFSSWSHIHIYEPFGNNSSFLEDRINYDIPLRVIGKLVARTLVERRLAKIFDYRHRTSNQDIHDHRTMNKNNKQMNILICGSSGFIGSAVIPFLTTGGYNIIRLVRSSSLPAKRPSLEQNKQNSTKVIKFVKWDPVIGFVNLPLTDDSSYIDAVVNLSGENIYGKWTKEKKRKILDSRVQTTKLLCKTLASINRPPKVLVAGSATGYYGDRGNEILSEIILQQPAIL